MRVAIYARVSTDDQSSDAQLYDLREYCRLRDWRIVREYVDEGMSGAEINRPQFNELLRDAWRRKFQAVLVWRFDRLSRKTLHLINSLETFRTAGIDFVSFQEQIDTTTVTGKMIFTVLAAIAEMERSTIHERVRAGIRAARAGRASRARRASAKDAFGRRARGACASAGRNWKGTGKPSRIALDWDKRACAR